MQIQIQVNGLPGSSKLRRLAAQKLGVALARFAHLVRDASVCLDDINGPQRGGVDKVCRLVLNMNNDSVLVIEDLAIDITQAIDRVAERLHQSVSRQRLPLAHTEPGGMQQNSVALATV